MFASKKHRSLYARVCSPKPFLGVALVIIVAVLLSQPLLAVELGDFTTPLFSSAGNCAFCHDPWTPGDTRSGAPLATDWRATMMAHSFKDPLWRATMEHEVKENPKLKSFIENKCLTCHAPMARTQAAADGTNELSFADALNSPLANEGVSCTLCHQIQDSNLGTHASFTGHYQIGTNRLIFGPYKDVVTMPMQHHVDYTPVHGAHVQDSKLCATCHTLFTPILDGEGAVVGEFPEQTPYLEWQNSAYALDGKHCQDCHMPRVDTPVKVASRPPWVDKRSPFWKHQFVGGNAFMLDFLADNAKSLKPNAEPKQLRAMAERARENLRDSANLQVTGMRESNVAEIHVVVENLTGHKFPTGHPFRRAWLHLVLLNSRGKSIFESGAADKKGAIRNLDGGYEKHYDVITKPEQVQIYQSVMEDTDGNATWSLLRGAAYLKDNRIPPRGFTNETAPSTVAIMGVGEDSNFNLGGSGTDEVTYLVPLKDQELPLIVRVELLYQAVPPESVAHLLKSKEPNAVAFTKMFRRQPNQPELVHRVELKL